MVRTRVILLTGLLALAFHTFASADGLHKGNPFPKLEPLAKVAQPIFKGILHHPTKDAFTIKPPIYHPGADKLNVINPIYRPGVDHIKVLKLSIHDCAAPASKH